MRDRLASLRVRLAAAMLLVLLLAVAASSLIDRLALSPGSVRLAHALEQEPTQDGLVLVVFGLAVLALIWAVSAWSLRPLAQASREAAAAGPAHPGARISTHGLPSEIRPLVEAVNGALSRLEEAVEAERRFTADAAHELRTPLAILGLRLQGARNDAAPDWSAIDHDLGQMNRLVGQLLDLARKEQAGRMEADAVPVNLSRVAREAAAAILPLAEARNRSLHADLPETMMLRGRAGDLRDMLLNLLENAIVHGTGAIGIVGRSRSGLLTLDVADEGGGVAEPLRDAVFQRFRKACAASPGTGLGLAIVREVAVSHGGSAAFMPGAAAVIRVTLPGL